MSAASMTGLEAKVLECVRAHPGLSGNRIAREVGRRRSDVLGALRGLEGLGVLYRSTDGAPAPGTGSQGGWHPGSPEIRSQSTASTPRTEDVMVVGLTRAEAEALLWLERVVGHAFGREHPDDGASASAAQKLEAALAEERRAA
jgi:hypothetical protein